MNTTQQPDEPLDRLRAADPAPSAVPDEAALRRAAFERAGIEDGGAERSDEAPVVDLAARRRRRPWLVAAAAAAVVAVGGGGYAAGMARDGGEEPVSAVGTVAATAEPAVPGTVPEVAGADSATRGMPGTWRTVFHDGGVGGGASSARAWAYDAAAGSTREAAARAAAALGIAGDVREEDGTYVAGPADWSGPSLRLQADGMATLYYDDPAAWACDIQPADGAVDRAGSSAATSGPVPCPAAPTGPAPSPEDAAATVRNLVEQLGVDVSTLDFTATVEAGSSAWVQGALRIDGGADAGVSWTATVTGDGVTSLSGPLAPLVDLGEYNLVTPAQAVERLNDPRFGADVGIVQPWAVPENAPGMPSATVPPVAQPGAPLSWPVTDVTITGAQLGWTSVWQEDGAVVLAPAYVLSAADGSTWSVIAVADGGLAFGG